MYDPSDRTYFEKLIKEQHLSKSIIDLKEVYLGDNPKSKSDKDYINSFIKDLFPDKDSEQIKDITSSTADRLINDESNRLEKLIKDKCSEFSIKSIDDNKIYTKVLESLKSHKVYNFRVFHEKFDEVPRYHISKGKITKYRIYSFCDESHLDDSEVFKIVIKKYISTLVGEIMHRVMPNAQSEKSDKHDAFGLVYDLSGQDCENTSENQNKLSPREESQRKVSPSELEKIRNLFYKKAVKLFENNKSLGRYTSYFNNDENKNVKIVDIKNKLLTTGNQELELEDLMFSVKRILNNSDIKCKADYSVNLCGKGGSGKTFQIMKLMELIFNNQSKYNNAIPLYIPLNVFNGNKANIGENCIITYLQKVLKNDSVNTLENLLKMFGSDIIVFADGFNEITSNILRQQIANSICDIRQRFKTRFLVSSRVDHTDLFNSLNYGANQLFVKAEVMDLNIKQINDYFRKVECPVRYSRLSQSVRKLVKTPQGCVMYAELEKKESDVNSLGDLLDKYCHSILGINNKNYEKILRDIAYQMVLDEKFEILEDDLSVILERHKYGGSILNSKAIESVFVSKSDNLWEFSHQNYRDYFCAKFFAEKIKSINSKNLNDIFNEIFAVNNVTTNNEILELVSEFIPDDKNSIQSKINILRQNKECLKGIYHNNYDFPLSVLIRIYSYSHNNCLAKLNLSGLNLTEVCLSGYELFDRTNSECIILNKAKIGLNTFLKPGLQTASSTICSYTLNGKQYLAAFAASTVMIIDVEENQIKIIRNLPNYGWVNCAVSYQYKDSVKIFLGCRNGHIAIFDPNNLDSNPKSIFIRTKNEESFAKGVGEIESITFTIWNNTEYIIFCNSDGKVYYRELYEKGNPKIIDLCDDEYTFEEVKEKFMAYRAVRTCHLTKIDDTILIAFGNRVFSVKYDLEKGVIKDRYIINWNIYTPDLIYDICATKNYIFINEGCIISILQIMQEENIAVKKYEFIIDKDRTDKIRAEQLESFFELMQEFVENCFLNTKDPPKIPIGLENNSCYELASKIICKLPEIIRCGNVSTESIINSLKNFMQPKGLVSNIYNGKVNNFIFRFFSPVPDDIYPGTESVLVGTDLMYDNNFEQIPSFFEFHVNDANHDDDKFSWNFMNTEQKLSTHTGVYYKITQSDTTIHLATTSNDRSIDLFVPNNEDIPKNHLEGVYNGIHDLQIVDNNNIICALYDGSLLHVNKIQNNPINYNPINIADDFFELLNSEDRNSIWVVRNVIKAHSDWVWKLKAEITNSIKNNFRIYSCSYDGTLRLSDMETKNQLLPIVHSTEEILDLFVNNNTVWANSPQMIYYAVKNHNRYKSYFYTSTNNRKYRTLIQQETFNGKIDRPIVFWNEGNNKPGFISEFIIKGENEYDYCMKALIRCEGNSFIRQMMYHIIDTKKYLFIAGVKESATYIAMYEVCLDGTYKLISSNSINTCGGANAFEFIDSIDDRTIIIASKNNKLTLCTINDNMEIEEKHSVDTSSQPMCIDEMNGLILVGGLNGEIIKADIKDNKISIEKFITTQADLIANYDVNLETCIFESDKEKSDFKSLLNDYFNI